MAQTKIKALGKATDLATRLDVPRHRAYELIREGRIPGVVRIGRQVRVDMDVVEDWIRSGGDATTETDG
jgi:excisionase family DNA binding protein